MRFYLLRCVSFSLGLAVLLVFSESASGAIIQFDLGGVGGDGLLPTNERPNVASGTGSGGEIGSGIVFDDITKELSINVGWGSGQGFTDLTGVVNAGHLHDSSGNGGGILGFGGVLQGLTIADNSANNGLVNTTITLTGAQETLLLAGDTYLNFHTTANGGGEIRGNLLQVTAIPEPTSTGVLAAVLMGVLVRRGRRR